MTIDPVCAPEEFDHIIHSIMLPAFLVLEDAWHRIVTANGPIALVDLKMEVGRRLDNEKIAIADVIDNNSWRIWPGGDPMRQLDKQCFRDDRPLFQVAENYVTVADMTGEFDK